MKYLIALFLSLIMTTNAYATYIYITTPNDNVSFMLIDYNGKKTGYDPATKTVVSESGLPVMAYYLWNPENPNIPGSADTPQYLLQGKFPVNKVPLVMKLVLTGNKTAFTKNISVEIEEYTGSRTTKDAAGGVITTILDNGQIANYDISYIPSKSLILTKIATSNDLLADITTAQKLNLIGNAHFVSEAIEKINEIEKERIKPAEKDDDHNLTPAQKAKKEYAELLKEITEKYNKPESDEFVKQEAYTVLKEDLEYIISHIQ